MSLLKFLFLITVASKACLAQEDFQDFFKKGECDANTEGCPTLEDWKDNFLKGECDKFNDAVAKLDDWNVRRHEIQTLIETNYKGDKKMAQNILNCLFNMTVGTTFEIYETKAIGYLALYRMLVVESQTVTDISLKTSIGMSQVASIVSTFQTPERGILEGYMKQYKKEVLPSVKSMCFDMWVQIKHPTESKHLAISLPMISRSDVDMWPNVESVWVNENSFKWHLHREYRIDMYGVTVIDVSFKNVRHNHWLASNDKGEVVGTSETKDHYHWWTAELVELKDDEVGRFRFKNKRTGKYLKGGKFRVVSNNKIRIQSMTTDPNDAINLIIH